MEDMKYRIYHEGGDSQIFVTENKESKTAERNDFVFTGFANSIHPYHRKRIKWFSEALKSKGIILNIAEVPTIGHMSNDMDAGEFTFDSLTMPKKEYLQSEDGNTYVLFQDTEMGRGWACLIKNKEIISQDHRDNILDEIEEGEFIRSFDIDYKVVAVKSLKMFKL